MQVAASIDRSYRHFFLIALSVLLAVWGEWALFTEHLVLDGVVLLSAAAVMFARLVLRGPRLVTGAPAPGTEADSQGGLVWANLRIPFLASLTCAVLTWGFSSGNSFRPQTLLFWFLACALYLRAFWDQGKASNATLADRVRDLVRRPISLSWHTVAVGLVFLLAAFFRYYQIGTVPAEMTSDHAEKLLDVRDVMNGQLHIFFPRNAGREPLQFYMAVPFVVSLGLGHLALKALTATVSLMTVPLVYLIGRETGGAKFGLLAAFFLAVSTWDVGIGRVGLRFPYYPFFVALAFFFLLRALRHGRRNDYLLCGLATGIGLYGYSPFRAMVLLIVVAVLVKIALEHRLGWRTMRPIVVNLALCLGIVVVVFLPLAHYMAENPQMFWLRTLSRLTDQGASMTPNPLGVFFSNLANGLLMFNWRGDEVWVNLMTTEDIAKQNPPPGNKLYIINKDDKDAVRALQQRFPEGQLRQQPSATLGQQFEVFFVPGRP